MARRLYRSRTDRMVWGICGGLAKYFDVDPVLVRIAFVLLFFASGIGLLAYIVMAIIVPVEGSTAATPGETARENIEEIKQTATEIGESVRASMAKRGTSTETESARTRHSRSIVAIILILVGLIFLLASLNIFWWFQLQYFWPVLLIIIGLLIILTARRK